MVAYDWGPTAYTFNGAYTVGGGGPTYPLEIDSFDSWDGTNYSGDTGKFAAAATPTVSGGSLESTDDFYAGIYSTSGLPNYPGKGSVFEVYILSTGVSASCDAHIDFGLASTSSDGYRIRAQMDTSFVRLSSVSGGTPTDLDTASIGWGSYSADTWYKIEVTWDDGTINGVDNQITVEFYDSGETTSTQLQATDSTYAAEDGIGWAADEASGAGNVHFDEAQITA